MKIKSRLPSPSIQSEACHCREVDFVLVLEANVGALTETVIDETSAKGFAARGFESDSTLLCDRLASDFEQGEIFLFVSGAHQDVIPKYVEGPCALNGLFPEGEPAILVDPYHGEIRVVANPAVSNEVQVHGIAIDQVMAFGRQLQFPQLIAKSIPADKPPVTKGFPPSITAEHAFIKIGCPDVPACVYREMLYSIPQGEFTFQISVQIKHFGIFVDVVRTTVRAPCTNDQDFPTCKEVGRKMIHGLLWEACLEDQVALIIVPKDNVITRLSVGLRKADIAVRVSASRLLGNDQRRDAPGIQATMDGDSLRRNKRRKVNELMEGMGEHGI